MDQRHPYKIIIYSLFFLLSFVLLLLFMGHVEFDYIFDFKWYYFDFYYSVLVYWYGLFGYKTLIFGIFVSLCYAIYALLFNTKLTKRVLAIFSLSPISGSLFAYFYYHKFIHIGFVGESIGYLLDYYMGPYGKWAMFSFQGFIIFFLFPLGVWRSIFFVLLKMIEWSKVLILFTYLWNNFLGFIYFLFNKKNKYTYLDDLIKKSIDKDFENILLKYPILNEEEQGLLQKYDVHCDYSYAGLYIKKYGQNSFLSENQNKKILPEELSILVDGLNHFHIFGNIEATFKGPYLHTIIFTPDKAVKMNLIFKVQDDLGRIIGRPDLRIIYPVKDYVYSLAIEYAHHDRDFDFYFLPYFLDSQYLEFEPLIILLGLDSFGDPFYFNLKDAPHMLVAGTTGSGKSTILNSIIFNLIWKYREKDLEIYLIDPKKSEFFIYEKCRIIKKIGYAINDIIDIFKKLICLMDERYSLFHQHGYRNIDEAIANKMTMQYIVVVIDEYADIVMQSKIAEQYCLRLLQMSRAAGIYIIVSTQRPSVDIITGTLKSNLPTRIACRVVNQINSKIILDDTGAEKLLGKGDMIFFFQGKYSRIHSFYIDTGFITKLYLK